MNMMKNLYETGDDDMKRTIAESFSKARSGEKVPGDSFGSGVGGAA